MITPSDATNIVATVWPQREQALAFDDLAATDRLETGVAREFDDAVTKDDLGRHIPSLRHIRGHGPISVFVTRQTSYPAQFLAEVETQQYGGSNPQPWVEMMIFSKASASAPWLVTFVSGALGSLPQQPVGTDGGFEIPPPSFGWLDPTSVGPMLASYWQTWRDTQAAPPDSLFLPGYWTTQHGQQDIARTGQGGLSPDCGCRDWVYYRSDARDGIYQFAVAPNGGAGDIQVLVCSTVRYRDVRHPHGIGVLYQNSSRSNWGGWLPPGRYSSLTIAGLRQTCVLGVPASRDLGLDVIGGNGDDTNVTGSKAGGFSVFFPLRTLYPVGAVIAAVIVSATRWQRRRRMRSPDDPWAPGRWPPPPPPGPGPGPGPAAGTPPSWNPSPPAPPVHPPWPGNAHPDR